MAIFHYVVKDPAGLRKEGTIQAASQEVAAEKLTQDGFTIIQIKDATQLLSKKRGSFVDRVSTKIQEIKNRIPLKSMVFFTRQLATMFAAGLTLERAIDNLAQEEKNRKFQKILRTISSDIRKGYSLSEALAEHPGAFSNLYIALVRSGEVSGTLHTVLSQLADHLEGMEDLRRKVTSALTYPIFILIFLVVVTIGLITFIVPLFADVYSKFDYDLPLPTQMLINLSDLIVGNALEAILMALLVFVGLALFGLTERGRRVYHTILLKFPVIGYLMENSIMATFSKTLSILMSSGVTVMESLKLVERVVGNAIIEKAIEDARSMIGEGIGIANAFKRTRQFPSTLLQLMQTGEETGDMDNLLARCADFYQKLVDSTVDRLTTLLEPLIIILMGVVVGGVIVSVYLPIFQLGQAIKSGMR